MEQQLENEQLKAYNAAQHLLTCAEDEDMKDELMDAMELKNK